MLLSLRKSTLTSLFKEVRVSRLEGPFEKAPRTQKCAFREDDGAGLGARPTVGISPAIYRAQEPETPKSLRKRRLPRVKCLSTC